MGCGAISRDGGAKPARQQPRLPTAWFPRRHVGLTNHRCIRHRRCQWCWWRLVAARLVIRQAAAPVLVAQRQASRWPLFAAAPSPSPAKPGRKTVAPPGRPCRAQSAPPQPRRRYPRSTRLRWTRRPWAPAHARWRCKRRQAPVWPGSRVAAQSVHQMPVWPVRRAPPLRSVRPVREACAPRNRAPPPRLPHRFHRVQSGARCGPCKSGS